MESFGLNHDGVLRPAGRTALGYRRDGEREREAEAMRSAGSMPQLEVSVGYAGDLIIDRRLVAM